MMDWGLEGCVGQGWGAMMSFMWLNYLLFLALVILAIIALLKYLKK